MSLFLFLILVVTGILLMFYYVPSTTQAYDRMLDLRGTVAFGIFLRNMHRWSAHGMVAMVFLHMCRVFLTGAYKKPREFNWVLGVVLLLVTLFLSFTGYLLPWDQLAFWAITVGTSIAGYAPADRQADAVPAAGRHHGRTGSAAALLRAARGGAAGGAGAADRDPLLAHPQGRRPVAARRQRSPAAVRRDHSDVVELAKKRVYGLQGFVRGPFTKVGNVPDDSVYSWPNLLIAELFVFVLTVAADPGGVAAVQRAARRAGERHASAESGESAVVLPRPAGDGQLLGLLGRHRHPGHRWWLLLLVVPYHRPQHRRRGPLVRQGAAAGQHALPDAGGAQRDLHHHRHVLPRAELGVRLAVLERTIVCDWHWQSPASSF